MLINKVAWSRMSKLTKLSRLRQNGGFLKLRIPKIAIFKLMKRSKLQPKRQLDESAKFFHEKHFLNSFQSQNVPEITDDFTKSQHIFVQKICLTKPVKEAQPSLEKSLEVQELNPGSHGHESIPVTTRPAWP